MTATLDTERRAAIAAVRAASGVCQNVRRTLVTADTLEKRDRSPVTVADFAAQAVVGSMMRRSLPDDVIIGEEQADQLRDDEQAPLRDAVVRHVRAALPDDPPDADRVMALIDAAGTSRADGDRYWTLDPIDGTKGFLRGEQYAIALALLESTQVVLAALACPNLEHAGRPGLLLVAGRGGGTRCLALDGADEVGVPVRTADVAETSSARFCESVESGHSSHGDAARVAERLGISTPSLRMDSKAKYATVARGEAHIYLRLPTRPDYREKIWDHAAGALVVVEAGGRVSDIDGRPLDFAHGRQLEQNRGIVATGGRIHDEVVAAVRQVLGNGPANGTP